MKQDDKFTVINIREYLKKNADDEEQFGEDALRQLLSEFSCERNQDVEDFLKRQAIDFTNKHQSVTYLVFDTDDAQLLGYFALTIKPITVSGEPSCSLSDRSAWQKLCRWSKREDNRGRIAWLGCEPDRIAAISGWRYGYFP